MKEEKLSPTACNQVACSGSGIAAVDFIMERAKRTNADLKIVKNLTNKLVDLKQKHKAHFNKLKSLSVDEQKEINKLLRDRHIKIWKWNLW